MKLKLTKIPDRFDILTTLGAFGIGNARYLQFRAACPEAAGEGVRISMAVHGVFVKPAPRTYQVICGPQRDVSAEDRRRQDEYPDWLNQLPYALVTIRWDQDGDGEVEFFEKPPTIDITE